MPRAFDRKQLPIDRDPLQQLDDFGNLPKLKFPDLGDWWEAVVRMIKEFTGLDLSSIQAFVQSIIEVLVKTLVKLDELFKPIINAIWAGFGMGSNIINGIIDALTPAHVHETLAAINAGIVDLQQLIASLPSGVFEKFDAYPTGDSMGSRWEQVYESSGGISSGFFGIEKGRAKFRTVQILNNRICRAFYKGAGGKAETDSDYQRISAVFSTAPESGLFGASSFNELMGRCNTARTEWVSARFSPTACAVVYKLATGSEVVIRTIPYKMKAAATYSIECGVKASDSPRTYRVFENQQLLMEAVDTTNKSPLGVANRRCGLTGQATSTSVMPGSFAAWSFYDQTEVSLGSGIGAMLHEGIDFLGSVNVPLPIVIDPEPEPEGV